MHVLLNFQFHEFLFSKATLCCGFKKGYSTQHSLLVMLEKRKNATNKGKCFAVLSKDLSKTFDCLSDETKTFSKLPIK